MDGLKMNPQKMNSVVVAFWILMLILAIGISVIGNALCGPLGIFIALVLLATFIKLMT